MFIDRLHDAIQAKIRFEQRSYSFCRYDRATATLNNLMCTCSAADANSYARTTLMWLFLTC